MSTVKIFVVGMVIHIAILSAVLGGFTYQMSISTDAYTEGQHQAP